MPEKVTREEKIIELAILKARETLEALRDGEDTKPIIEKVKRPKAKASKHGIKQDKVHANAGGEEFTSGKIKKGKTESVKSIRMARAFVLQKDREIEKQLAKGVLNEEETKELKQTQLQVKVAYRELTKQMNMLAKSKGGFGDFKKDDRDVEFTEEQQQMANETFTALEAAMKKITSEYLTSPLSKQGKMESDMKEIVDDLKELTMYFGRSS
ncbi:hypothetical protein N8470_00075 [bacterium]|jgi:hypothetical protein|nr:hypothetical protein [bacterium]MDA8843578.1 hypothetical protein [Euryarchaeota archaeon]